MRTLRVIAVDDEPLALTRLGVALARLDHVCLVAAETNARKALRLIAEFRPDVLILDIEMPGLDGFDLIERLDPASAPAVIFATAYDQHAVRAFESNAIDYLMKPVHPARLEAALAKARKHLQAGETETRLAEMQRQVETLRHLSATPAPGDHSGPVSCLWMHRNRELVRVPVTDIRWIEAEGDYVRIHARSGEGLIRETLTGLEERLGAGRFMRVHRSAIVARNQIASVRRKRSSALVARLTGGEEIAVGRQYAKGLKDFVRQAETGRSADPAEGPA